MTESESRQHTRIIDLAHDGHSGRAIGVGLAVMAGLLLLLLPAAVQAQYGYTTANGAVTITGYTGPGGAVAIPSAIDGLPVTGIGDNAFNSVASLTSVTIPASVTSIGGAAFAWCTSLISVTVPASVTNIGVSAFAYCYHLTAITVDAANPAYRSVAGVWFDISQSTLIQYPTGNSNQTYAIPASVTNIGVQAFYANVSLTDITIPASVTSLADQAFGWCASLTNIMIPASVTSLGVQVFAGCVNLTAITVDPNNPAFSSVDGVLFDKSQTTLIQYPGGRAGGYTIPNTVTSIGDEAFQYCNLASVTIPNGITNIGVKAFQNNTNLTSVTIPASVANLGFEAFDGCRNLTAITVDPGNPFLSSVAGAMFDKNQTRLIEYSDNSAGDYTIPAIVTSIGDGAFHDSANLTNVLIPAGVASIGAVPFAGCPNLTAITVDPNNLDFSSVDGVLFDKNQTTLIECPVGRTGAYTVPAGVTSIGSSAFRDCTNLTSVTISSSVTNIGGAAFNGCTTLTGIYFQGNGPSLGAYALSFNSATVYYLAGATGFDTEFGSRPTAVWIDAPDAIILVAANPPQGGTVTGGGSYLVSNNVPITATANSGWLFAGWNDGGAPTHDITVPAGGATYTATFTQQLVNVGVGANPAKSGTVSGSGLYPMGTVQTISATASNPWVFIGWEDGATNATRTITVPAIPTTYTADFGWTAPQDYVKIAQETCRDLIGYTAGKQSFVYPTGAFNINAVVFTGAGLTAANLAKNTPVKIRIGNWTYQGATGTLGDDPKFTTKATKVTLPLLYHSNGATKSAGTVTIGLGKKNTTLTVAAKAGRDAQQNVIQNFVVSDTLTGGAAPGHTVPTNITVSATITIGNYSESFNHIVITGTAAAANSKAKDGKTQRLDTVKVKGSS